MISQFHEFTSGTAEESSGFGNGFFGFLPRLGLSMTTGSATLVGPLS
jgi:hypothetical protein